MNTQEIYRFLNRGLPIIGSGAIGTAPAPSASNLGALWVDGAVVYQSRWIVNLTGSDVMTHDFLNAKPNESNFSLSYIFKDAIAGATNFDVLFDLRTSANQVCLRVARSNTGTIYIQAQDAGGGTAYQVFSALTLTDSSFHRLLFESSGDWFRLYIDGVLFVSGTKLGFSMAVATAVRYTDQSSLNPYQIYNILGFVNSVPTDSIPCTESSGTTLANTLAPSRPATITDSTAHIQAWVPINL